VEQWQVKPGADVDLSAIDPASIDGAPGDEEATKEAFKALRHELADAQERLYAEKAQSLLVVIQAIDGGGKDSTIKKVFRGVNPQGCRVASFKKPTEQELAHDFLWRVHKVTPETGEIGVFNRSHYEDVLIVRVHNLVPERVWRERYDIINAFEHGLLQARTRIVKLFLHISKDEQKRRFEKRQENPTKRWKYKSEDEEERKYWDDYQAAFRDAIANTSTDEAPWFVVPADNKWYRNWVVATILAETLRDMDPQYPA
jgi:PPK2 family polyphosphate:nucleotide phosphotransferase